MPAANNTTIDSVARDWDYYAIASWCTGVFCASFVANALSAYNVLASPSLRNPSMHILCAGFIGNCLCVLSAASLNLASAWLAGQWAFPMAWCYWYVFSTSSLGLFNINLLTGLSALRCRMVTRNQPFGRAHVIVLICLSAAIAAAWSLPPLFGVAGVRRVGRVAACDLDWETGLDGDKAYLGGLLTGEFVLPLIIIVCSYVAIFEHIRRHRSSMVAASSRNQARRDRQFVVHVLALFLTFLICWTPYAVLSVCSLAGPLRIDSGLYESLSTAALLMAKTGMGASALAYFAVNAEFRSAFAATPLGKRLRCCWACLPKNHRDSNAGMLGQHTEAIEMRRRNRGDDDDDDDSSSSEEREAHKLVEGNGGEAPA